MATQFLKTGQLQKLQRLTQKAMPDQVTILVPGAATNNGYGGAPQSFTDGPTVACRFRSYTQKADSVQGGQGKNQELFLFTLPIGTVIDVNYRLRRNGIEYEVVGEPTDSSHQISKKVLAKKL